tara:strand:- start:950 stop:1165 length:216 start_codon:yes stop_codon:yes gene_type:complete
MKVGDLIKVKYAIKNPYDDSLDGWGDAFIGVVTETPNSGKYSVLTMYCFEQATSHVLMPELDLIEVISESR